MRRWEGRAVGNRSARRFEDIFEEYLEAIRAAHARGAHHDQLREVFARFIEDAFGIRTTEMDREVFVPTGWVDLMWRGLVVDVKRDLDRERDDGREKLHRYLSDLGSDNHVGVLTDGVNVEVYMLRDGTLLRFEDVSLASLSPAEAYRWLDSYLFSQPELVPSAEDVARRFGPSGPVARQSLLRLGGMFDRLSSSPTLQVRLTEWSRLLEIAYGSDISDRDLFLRHTYLATVAKLLAFYGIFRRRPRSRDELFGCMVGSVFSDYGLANLVEEDFFVWFLEAVEDAEEFLATLSTHLNAYSLERLDEDVLKVLYEELVEPATRRVIGEYYTPDWLAEYTCREAELSEEDRVLDPACGSGTFLFIAIRLWREAGFSGDELAEKVATDLVGFDINPLAVIVARVNVVLALAAADSLTALSVPVYLASSIVEPEYSLLGETLRINAEGHNAEFHLPSAADWSLLDRLVTRMVDFAKSSQSDRDARAGWRAVLEAEEVPGEYDAGAWIGLWLDNFEQLRLAVTEGRDTIWAFILRNSYRPVTLSRGKVTLVVGNPPWVPYRYLQSRSYRQDIRGFAIDRYQLLSSTDTNLLTQIELATVFFARCVDRYLDSGGRIAFVMPRSVWWGGRQHQGFRTGTFGPTSVRFDLVVDLDQVEPLFGVPAAVIVAVKEAAQSSPRVLALRGELPRRNASWAETRGSLEVAEVEEDRQEGVPEPSPYHSRAKEGASLVPRSLWWVQPRTEAGLRVASRGPVAVQTADAVMRRAREPWDGLCLTGAVESQFVFASALGADLVPFGFSTLKPVIVPLGPDGDLLSAAAATRLGFTGLAAWLEEVEEIWTANRTERADRMAISALDRLDYHSLLTTQPLTGGYVVLYNEAGVRLRAVALDYSDVNSVAEAARWEGIHPAGYVSDYTTFWVKVNTLEEAHYLAGVLNTPALYGRVAPTQTRGAYGARHIQRRPFEVAPIPRYDRNSPLHRSIRDLSAEAAAVVRELAPDPESSVRRLENQISERLGDLLRELDARFVELW
jgi:hypothetical protein